jgi:SAM-dependent methyltransferase
MDITDYNKRAWDSEVGKKNPWTVPVGREDIARAKKGEWSIVLTPTKPVPRDWFPELAGCEILCLASGGGQQGPVLAAAGANVTVLDNSPAQLEQDRLLATVESLHLDTVESDMTQSFPFDDAAIDLIVHPVSNIFVQKLEPVWRECFRVLKPGGFILSGMVNPVTYLFDIKLMEQHGILQVRYCLPYSDVADLEPEEVERLIENSEPVEFSHTLDELLGGQLKAGFVITGFYEDARGAAENDLLSKHMQPFFATRAKKPAQ